MLSNPFAGGADSPSMSTAGAIPAAVSSPSQGLDSFFAAFSAGTANLATAADLLTTALALPLSTSTVVPTLAAMTPPATATPPSLQGGTDSVVTASPRLSGSPTFALAPQAAFELADDWGSDILT